MAFLFSATNTALHAKKGVGATRAVLLQEIVRSCRGRDCLAVFHAGACGSNSRCVVFPAGTQSGKTTLAAVLMKMGLTFYSDDSVLLERDTLSVPVMPFALTVREGSWDVLNPRFPELQDLPILPRYGQRVRFLPPVRMKGDGQCGQVAAIVFVRFNPESATEIGPVDTLQTLLRLQESGFWVAHDQQSIRAFLAWIQSTRFLRNELFRRRSGGCDHSSARRLKFRGSCRSYSATPSNSWPRAARTRTWRRRIPRSFR